MKRIIFSCFFVFFHVLFSQATIEGKITSSRDASAVAGANIQVKDKLLGAVSDVHGEFKFTVDKIPVEIVISYIGFKTKTITVKEEKVLHIKLEEAVVYANDVVVVGSRYKPRTVITSPVPIDNIDFEAIKAVGQTSFDKMLHYIVPSFNSTQQTVSDATAHFDPADLRGLGPSRTLVLINGKRKNASALVYINDTPGKGEVGVDMKSIPVSAIKRVEVLRDGASAQYGSDAIAGVINIILKNNSETTSVNTYSGVTNEGDGFEVGASVNSGFKLGKSGFLNLTLSLHDQKETNRAGSPGADSLFKEDSKWTKENPELGMHVGLPNITNVNLFFNSEIEINEYSTFYTFGGIGARSGKSYALYRTPYWVKDPYNVVHLAGETYNGFQPTFQTSIGDQLFTVGVRTVKDGWRTDISYSYGKNLVDYSVRNSLNVDLKEKSPTVFNTGGYRFSNDIFNFDLSKTFAEKYHMSIGSEVRVENFVAVAGDEASYFGKGAQSFPGLRPKNALDAKRNNIGVYFDIGVDFTESFFAGATVRHEKYSDFGANLTYKVNARYMPLENLNVRGSYSTGFRAPSLHQVYLSNIQTLVSGGTVSNQGTFNNDSPVLRNLGVKKLKEEVSRNFTFGVAVSPVKNMYVSADYFSIDVDDRIVYSSSIADKDPNTTVGGILKRNKITSLKFFLNAVNTSSSGFDLTFNYKTSISESENLSVNAAYSQYSHSIRGTIKTPEPIAKSNISVLDRKEQSRFLTARPSQKFIFGPSFEYGALSLGVRTTYFGDVTWKHASKADKDQTFSAKWIFDFNGGYQLTKFLLLAVSVNNVFDTYPDVIDTKDDPVTDLGGRFKYPWEVNQFGFNGRTFLVALNFKLN